MITDAASAFVVITMAELADKTQLLAMGLTARYKLGEVATGITLAIMTLNLLGVGVGRFVAGVLPGELVRLVAGLSFLAFAVISSVPPDGGEKERRQTRLGGIPAIYAAFMLAELGDKTQLGVLSLTAAKPDAALGIFIGATAGMLVADGLAMTLGVLLGKALPQKLMCRLSAVVFTVFGAVMLYPALEYYLFDMAQAAALCIGLIFITALLLRMKGNDGGCHG
ncbi:MAG TPA: TMEM165/GDT1 family protein [Candidatus Acidoferrum sp.]|nr:TMEM165/GDT1 family protein [Candidatus Acidoferrum sp.]